MTRNRIPLPKEGLLKGGLLNELQQCRLDIWTTMWPACRGWHNPTTTRCGDHQRHFQVKLMQLANILAAPQNLHVLPHPLLVHY